MQASATWAVAFRPVSLRFFAIPFFALVPLAASAQYTYGWNHPSNWGAPQTAPGKHMYSFETTALPTGVTVGVSGGDYSNFAPTSTLPNDNHFNFVTGSGSYYSWGGYDGKYAFLTTAPGGDVTFSFDSPLDSVGFSLGNLAPGARLRINGVDQGEFLPHFSNLLTIEALRQGYFYINGPSISSFTIESVSGDYGFVMDHMFMSPKAVPEPGSVVALALGAMAMLRRRKQG
ncbi:PEP-CTERM sorting domain-containing protein [bacterium]|nr:MAG: PEP-CTERM sorting domain-containing protein [bacterium]